MTFDCDIGRKFDGGVLIGTGAPGCGFTRSEALVDITNGYETSPNLSFPAFDAGAVVMERNIGNANALGDRRFFVSPIGQGSQLGVEGR